MQTRPMLPFRKLSPPIDLPMCLNHLPLTAIMRTTGNPVVTISVPTNQVPALVQEGSSPFIPTPVVPPTEADPPPAVGENPTDTNPAGNISRYLKNWQLITSNNFFLQIIEHGYKIQFIRNPQIPCSVSSNPISLPKKLALEGEIARHLKSGAISKVKPKSDQLLSRIFSVPKPNGKCRMIIDLSLLNTQINQVHFKMEGPDSVKTVSYTHLTLPTKRIV